VQRFAREARAATRITSEHVVRLLEIEKLPSGTPFFVMEYLEGSDLRALLRERGALSPSIAVDYVLQALQAVAEGHVKGVVHRDIKPSNLFLTKRVDGTPLIKVLDFGIAKTSESDAAESTALTSSDDVRLGSPAYMPPEQLQNPRDVDKRSDIWSLGATLYELLCGRPPFEGNGYLELATHILREAPVPLSERDVPSTLPNGLERVLRKCLEKDREARYANAAELAAALAPFGSEDARVSLSRVSGMHASSSSFPALTRAVAISDTDCEPTLDVAGETAKISDDPRTSDLGALASEPPPARSRSALIVAIAAAAIVAIFALRNPVSTPRGDVTPPPVAASPAAAALETAAAPHADAVSVPPVAPTATTPPISDKPKHAVAAATRPAGSPPAVAATPAGVVAPPHGTQTASLQVQLPPELGEPVKSTEAPKIPQPSPSAGLGRSAEI
jgi:serine/threonine protein kinase